MLLDQSYDPKVGCLHGCKQTHNARKEYVSMCQPEPRCVFVKVVSVSASYNHYNLCYQNGPKEPVTVMALPVSQ